MNMIIGIIGVTLVGIGAGTLAYDWKVGACFGVIIFGGGLIIDSFRK